MRLPKISKSLMVPKYCSKRVWIILNTYSMDPSTESTDQYGALKRYRWPQLAIICKRIWLWWMLRLSIVKQNVWPGQLITSWSMILSMNVYILNKFVPPSSCGQSLCHSMSYELPLLVVCPPKMTTFPRYTLIKQRIAILNLEAALVHIYHVWHVDICPSKRIIPQLKHVPFM